MMQNNNIEQETICFQINLELGRFPGNHDYHVTYDPRCREIGVQLGELGGQWVPVDPDKFYSWLHNTPGLKWTDVVAMLVRKLRQTKQLNKQRNNGKDTHNH